jgi:hypothetical protein
MHDLVMSSVIDSDLSFLAAHYRGDANENLHDPLFGKKEGLVERHF